MSTQKQNEYSEELYEVEYQKLNSMQRNIIDKIIERRIREKINSK